ncbi:MAG: DUF1761 domain-containing protein [Patescibacteria group bacterium]
MNEEITTSPATASTKKINCCCGFDHCCSKIFLTALVITIIGTIIGFLTCGWLFKWIYAIEPTVAWKYATDIAPSGQAMAINFIGEFILAVILVSVFVKLYKGIPYAGWKKGVKFGFLVWLVSTLPGMFATYMWMNVAIEWIVYMAIVGLIVLLVKGAIVGAMCKKAL